MWFLLDDYSPTGQPDRPTKASTRVSETSTGTNKPAWYVFAGGNHLTLVAPASTAPGTTVTLTGTLSSDT